MSVSFCVVFEGEVPPYGTLGNDHNLLVRKQRNLDQLAEANGLTPLSQFENYAPEDFDAETQPVDMPPLQWFSATDGLAALTALVDYLTGHPEALRDSEAVITELEQIADELQTADRIGVRFRFAIVP
jgi:hypothetical protein